MLTFPNRDDVLTAMQPPALKRACAMGDISTRELTEHMARCYPPTKADRIRERWTAAMRARVRRATGNELALWILRITESRWRMRPLGRLNAAFVIALIGVELRRRARHNRNIPGAAQ